MVPAFAQVVTALDGKAIKVQEGFMMPLTSVTSSVASFWSRRRRTVSFCLPAGPDAMIECGRSPMRYG